MKNKTFDRLTVIEKQGRFALCRCECGTRKSVRIDHLKSGKTRSCGCLRSEVTSRLKTKHGMYGTKEYRTWCYIKDRCKNPSNQYYGGRGIGICQKWDESFEAFYDDVGPCPDENMTIDRIDVNGDYEPGNVKWSTWSEQQQNKTDTEYIAIEGVSLTPRQWCELSGVKFSNYRSRVRRGWDKVKALSVPPIPPKKRRDGAPADAQRAWLDKILELAIAAGMVTK